MWRICNIVCTWWWCEMKIDEFASFLDGIVRRWVAQTKLFWWSSAMQHHPRHGRLKANSLNNLINVIFDLAQRYMYVRMRWANKLLFRILYRNIFKFVNNNKIINKLRVLCVQNLLLNTCWPILYSIVPTYSSNSGHISVASLINKTSTRSISKTFTDFIGKPPPRTHIKLS